MALRSLINREVPSRKIIFAEMSIGCTPVIAFIAVLVFTGCNNPSPSVPETPSLDSRQPVNLFDSEGVGNSEERFIITGDSVETDQVSLDIPTLSGSRDEESVETFIKPDSPPEHTFDRGEPATLIPEENTSTLIDTAELGQQPSTYGTDKLHNLSVPFDANAQVGYQGVNLRGSSGFPVDRDNDPISGSSATAETEMTSPVIFETLHAPFVPCSADSLGDDVSESAHWKVSSNLESASCVKINGNELTDISIEETVFEDVTENLVRGQSSEQKSDEPDVTFYRDEARDDRLTDGLSAGKILEESESENEIPETGVESDGIPELMPAQIETETSPQELAENSENDPAKGGFNLSDKQNKAGWITELLPSSMKKSILPLLGTVGLLAGAAWMSGGPAATPTAKSLEWQPSPELIEWSKKYTFQNVDPKWYQGPYSGPKPWDNIIFVNR